MKRKKRKLKEEECVEIKKPPILNITRKDKQLWAVETNDLEIIKGLVKRFPNATVLDVLDKLQKDVVVLY